MTTIQNILSNVIETRTHGASKLSDEQKAVMGRWDGVYGDINGRPVVANYKPMPRSHEVIVTLVYVGGGAVPTRTIKKLLASTPEARIEAIDAELDEIQRDMIRVQRECTELIATCDAIKAAIAAL